MSDSVPPAVPSLRTITPEQLEAQNFDPVDDRVRERALDIINRLQKEGEDALLEYAWQFGEVPKDSRSFIL